MSENAIPPGSTSSQGTSVGDAATANAVISHAISDINQEFKEREVQQKARELGISYIDISLVPINPDLLSLVRKEDAEKAQIIPFFRVGQKLRVAVADPENPDTKRILEDLKNKSFIVNLNLCSVENLQKAQRIYETHYREKKPLIADVQQENSGNIQATISSLHDLPKVIEKLKSDEALNILHQQVLKIGLSDLHLEPQENGYRVRGRVDGILEKFFDLPPESPVSATLIRQIKYNARLKLNITNAPQDGQYFFQTRDRVIDVRVSTLPTKMGESVVLRFLDPKKGIVDLAELGFSPFHTGKIEEGLTAPNGLILVTGPTGSGKTTTLYSLLMRLNAPGKKIVTLEDPVEYHLSGIVQSQIDEEAGYTFSTGLRSLLRQDPDIVMVGEIRDLQTAETSVQAALTGHLVLSTIHTNSAIDAIPRLLNMGVKNYILAPSLRAIIAQRLVRKICPACSAERELTESEKAEVFRTLEEMTRRGIDLPEISSVVQEGKGCSECSGSGFRGEMAVAEVLLMNDPLRNAIFENASVQEIKQLAYRDKFRTMWEEGVLAVLAGKTTLGEVTRAVGK